MATDISEESGVSKLTTDQPNDATIVLGYTAEARADAREGTLEPPSKGEKPETQAKNRQKDWAAWEAAAPYAKVTGHIARIVAILPEFKVCMDTKVIPVGGVTQPASPAHAFKEWVMAYYPKAFNYRAAMAHNRVNFFGFHAKEFIRVLGMECVDAGVPAPLSLWYANDQTYDPFDMLVENDWRDQTPLWKLFARVGLDFPKGPYLFRKDAYLDCVAAAELVTRYGLAPAETSQALREMIKDLVAGKLPAAQPAAAAEAPAKKKKK